MDDESRAGAAPMVEDDAPETPETTPELQEPDAEASAPAEPQEPESPEASDASGPEPEAEGEAAEHAGDGGEPELAEEPAGEASAEAEGEPEPSEEEPEPAGPAREVTDEELEREVSALLLASPDPISVGRLRKFLGVPKLRIETALGALGTRLEEAGLPWELRAISGGWQLYTTPDMVDTVQVLSKVKKEEKVSPAALETLAVVAYRQPVTKAEIEAIRGVQVGPVLRTLVDRGLLKIAGRAEVPGSPLLYGTTKKFLDAFGLMQLEDLPRDAELMKD